MEAATRRNHHLVILIVLISIVTVPCWDAPVSVGYALIRSQDTFHEGRSNPSFNPLAGLYDRSYQVPADRAEILDLVGCSSPAQSADGWLSGVVGNGANDRSEPVHGWLTAESPKEASFEEGGVDGLPQADDWQSQTIAAASEDNSVIHLPSPEGMGVSVELCLNSRYSDHDLEGSASPQQLSNVLWAAGMAPVTGSYRDIHVSTSTGTYLYSPADHSLTWESHDVTPEGAFVIRYVTARAFDQGLSYMPALLGAVALWEQGQFSVASCPKGETSIYFGVQSVKGLTSERAVHSSVPEGEPGWLPAPSTTGEDKLTDVLANLQYVDTFAQVDLQLAQVSQILWAGYGCTPHTTSRSRAGLTVPSAMSSYYLTGAVYFANEDGVCRYHNRNPENDVKTRDHRTERLGSSDVRERLYQAVERLPLAPCYFILCLPDKHASKPYAQLEVGFVASNMLMQASAIDLACHFRTELSAEERDHIRAITGIPASHIPQAIVAAGPPVTAAEVAIALYLVYPPEDDLPSLEDVSYTVRLFAPGAAWRTDVAMYEFDSIVSTLSEEKVAVLDVPAVRPGTYDIVVFDDERPVAAEENADISSETTEIYMGTFIAGDATYDGVVDFQDYMALSTHWLASQPGPHYEPHADLNRDGLINTIDLFMLAVNWLRSSSTGLSQ